MRIYWTYCVIPDPNPNAGYYIGAFMIIIMTLYVFGFVSNLNSNSNVTTENSIASSVKNRRRR
jgi:hypothetical protein